MANQFTNAEIYANGPSSFRSFSFSCVDMYLFFDQKEG